MGFGTRPGQGSQRKQRWAQPTSTSRVLEWQLLDARPRLVHGAGSRSIVGVSARWPVAPLLQNCHVTVRRFLAPGVVSQGVP